MKLHLFCVYDTAAQAFLPPMAFKTEGEALRAFRNLANDPSSGIGANPEDFSLVQIGEFQDFTGVITSLEKPIKHGVAAGFIKEKVDA